MTGGAETRWRDRHAGRVVAVTGAAQGLGQAYAVRLAGEGATVVAADLNLAEETAELAAAAGGKVVPIRCDVTSVADVEGLRQATDELGGCDVLVNNAGVSPNVPWEEIDLETWRRVLAINLEGMFLTCKALTPAMTARGWGRVVNISSNTLGLAIPGFTAYMASKGGVIGFTRALATELGPHGVTVNAICPGLTRTLDTEAHWNGTPLFDEMVEQQAIKESGVPAHLVGAVSFLASEEAMFVTGQTLYVDGGLVRN
jgi:NAD(P)-dependent dehydrogenase (short-subunit alcohol dehydrogenase family)